MVWTQRSRSAAAFSAALTAATVLMTLAPAGTATAQTDPNDPGFLEPVLGAISWPKVLIGNLIAVVSMATYFWLRHRDLLPRLATG